MILQIQIKSHLYSVLDKWLIMYKVQATEVVLNFKVGRQSILWKWTCWSTGAPRSEIFNLWRCWQLASGVVVARFVLGRVAHRILTCGHNMWLLTCLSMCCRFGRVGHFFSFCVVGYRCWLTLCCFVSDCVVLFPCLPVCLFLFACQFVCLVAGC